MLWMVMTVTVVAGVVALTLVVRRTRRAAVRDLGTVSQQWIAESRVDWRRD
ncbi:MAG TPA: hypothetical protein VMW62_00815 [Chloroflexota bacterium]|nr:hypothetical protein [Chloroflexota bacterium]